MSIYIKNMTKKSRYVAVTLSIYLAICINDL